MSFLSFLFSKPVIYTDIAKLHADHLIYIFQYVADPLKISLVCNKWRTCIKDAKFETLLYQVYKRNRYIRPIINKIEKNHDLTQHTIHQVYEFLKSETSIFKLNIPHEKKKMGKYHPELIDFVCKSRILAIETWSTFFFCKQVSEQINIPFKIENLQPPNNLAKYKEWLIKISEPMQMLTVLRLTKFSFLPQEIEFFLGLKQLYLENCDCLLPFKLTKLKNLELISLENSNISLENLITICQSLVRLSRIVVSDQSFADQLKERMPKIQVEFKQPSTT